MSTPTIQKAILDQNEKDVLEYVMTNAGVAGSVSSVAGRTGAVTLAKADVGLSSVDNTSDATKNSASATLTNKTMTSPVINSPTGITKGDVGLSAVDNTSDAGKPVSTAQAAAIAIRAINTYTGDHTSVAGDAAPAIVRMNKASANTFTVDTHANVPCAVGTQIDVVQVGAGKTTIAGAGITFNPASPLSVAAQGGGLSLLNTGTDAWDVIGATIA